MQKKIVDFNEDHGSIVVEFSQGDHVLEVSIDVPVAPNGTLIEGAELDQYIDGFAPIEHLARLQQAQQAANKQSIAALVEPRTEGADPAPQNTAVTLNEIKTQKHSEFTKARNQELFDTIGADATDRSARMLQYFAAMFMFDRVLASPASYVNTTLDGETLPGTEAEVIIRVNQMKVEREAEYDEIERILKKYNDKVMELYGTTTVAQAENVVW